MSPLERIIEFGLAGAAPNEAASRALVRLIQLERSSSTIFSHRLGTILLPFFKKCPMEGLAACYFQDSDGSYSTALRILSLPLDRHGDTAVGAVSEETLTDWCELSPQDRYVFAAQTCKLFERPNPNGLGDESVMSISSTAKSVLAQAPDKKNILEIFISRFHPRSWSGSLAAILRQRSQLLDQLNPTEDADLQSLIEETKVRLSTIIAIEAQREQDRERSQTASFE